MEGIRRINLYKLFWLFALLFLVLLIIPRLANAAENENVVEIELASPKDNERYTTYGRNQTLIISGSTRAASGVEVTVKYSIISELCGVIVGLPCEKVKINSKVIHTYVSDGNPHPFTETLILSNITVPNDWAPTGDYSVHVWCEVEGTKVAEATREIRIVEPNSAAYLNWVDIQPSSSLVMIDPTFYPDDLDYTVKISGANSITFTPYLKYLTATMKVNGVSVENGEGVPISLQPNVPVTIAVEVTAENERNQLTYTFTFERVTSNNAYLQNLVLSDGSLTFDKNTFSYTVNVPYAVDRVTVTPTAEHETSSVKVNGVSVASGQASDWISLNQEYNEIKVEVTAEDGTTTKTYTITVRRQSGNADLQNLVLSGVNLPFDKDTLHYTVNVPYSVSSVTVTPTADDPLASVEVNGQPVTISNPGVEINLNVGANLISITVTAEDGTTKTYTITVRRQSGNADLSDLSLSSGTLVPPFDKDTFSYTVNVPYSVTSITVTPTAEDSSASIMVNGQNVASGTASTPVSLNVGDNPVTVTVISEDGMTTKTYKITVKRAMNHSASGGSGEIYNQPVNKWIFLVKQGMIRCCNNELILNISEGATDQMLRITVTQLEDTTLLSASLDEDETIVSHVFEIDKDKPGPFQNR